MYKKIYSILLCLLMFGSNVGANSKTATLTIDGVEHEVSIGKDHEIKIGSKEHLINIELSKYRKFEIDEISFQYDSNMSYTEDFSDPDLLIWKIDSNSNVILVQKFQTIITTELLVTSIRQQFQIMQAKVDVTDSILEHQGSELKGQKLNIQLGDIFLTQEVYTKEFNGQTIAFIIQDSLNDDKSNSTEYEDSMALLNETLDIK